jgi:ABC-type glycerol-3-phosphate transport system substrate-binding protein
MGEVKKEEKKVSRRDYLKYTGAAIGGLVVGGALGYLAKPAEVIERTVTAPGVTATTTIERTITKTITATTIEKPTTTGVITPLKITYLTHRWPYEMKDAYERAAALLEKKHPEFKTEYIGVPFAELEQKLITILPTPDAPDVIDAGFRIPFLPYLEPLDEYFEKYNVPVDDLIGQKMFGGMWPKEIGGDGHYYVFIRNVTNRACINYRRDVFKERGIEDPMEVRQRTGKYPEYKFFDEWYEIIKKCTYTRSDGRKVYGYAMPTAISDGNARWREEYLSWHYAFGGGIAVPEEPGKIVVGKEPYLSRNVKVAEFFRMLVEEELVPVGIEKPKYFDMMGEGLVAQGKEGTWVFARWTYLGEKREQLIGTYPNPYFGPGWKYLKEEFAQGGPSITKNGPCKDKEMVFKYIYYLCTDPEIVNQFFIDTLMLPGLKTIDLSPAIAKYPWLDAYDYVNKVLPTDGYIANHNAGFLANNPKNKPIIEKWGEITQAWFEMYQKVILSKEDIKDLHIQLQDKLEKMLSL